MVCNGNEVVVVDVLVFDIELLLVVAVVMVVVVEIVAEIEADDRITIEATSLLSPLLDIDFDNWC